MIRAIKMMKDTCLLIRHIILLIALFSSYNIIFYLCFRIFSCQIVTVSFLDHGRGGLGMSQMYDGGSCRYSQAAERAREGV